MILNAGYWMLDARFRISRNIVLFISVSSESSVTMNHLKKQSQFLYLTAGIAEILWINPATFVASRLCGWELLKSFQKLSKTFKNRVNLSKSVSKKQRKSIHGCFHLKKQTQFQINNFPGHPHPFGMKLPPNWRMNRAKRKNKANSPACDRKS